ncbi:MAG TPA: hypothetical protein PLV91_00020 [Verrucomicrobiota bacterium]|jgi:hypothetical protein|nr:hypothetical protein [Verrucomicrobiota bacterium]
MTSWFNSLNLKPQERRLVIGVLIGAFILVNVWFVWPHFGDWAKNVKAAEEAELKVNRYQNEVNNISRYRALIRELEQDGGARIAAAEQAVQFQKTIQEIANRSGVAINRYDPANPRRGALGASGGAAGSPTNSFFEESGLSVQMQQVEEKDLVLFLYNLGSGNSNIRVKELELNPHNTGTRLVCKALLIASYQKAPPAKSSQLAPAAKPGALSTNNGNARSNVAAAPASPAASATNPPLDKQPSQRAPGAATNAAPAPNR